MIVSEEQRSRAFVKHLAVATQRILERQHHKKRIHERLSNIQRLSSIGPTRKSDIEEEIQALHGHMDKVLDVESRLMHHHPEAPGKSSAIEERITALESKIDLYLEEKKRRQERITKIERKLSGQVQRNKEEFQTIESHIAELESKLAMMLKKGILNPQISSTMVGRIQQYKRHLEILKKKKGLA